MTSNETRTENPPMDDRELDRRLDALTRVAEAPPGNWAQIERRIGKRRRSWAVPAGLAAAAVLSGVLLVVSQSGPSPVLHGGIAETMQAEVQAMRVAAPEALAASDIDSPAAITAAWQENQQAIAQLERALEQDTDNRMLLEFLTEARMRQARLVRWIGRNDGIKQTPNNERSMTL